MQNSLNAFSSTVYSTVKMVNFVLHLFYPFFEKHLFVYPNVPSPLQESGKYGYFQTIHGIVKEREINYRKTIGTITEVFTNTLVAQGHERGPRTECLMCVCLTKLL